MGYGSRLRTTVRHGKLLYDDRMATLPEWSDPDRRDAALARIAARLREPDTLSRSELAVVFLLSHGVPNEKACEMLHVSPNTWKRHAEHVRWKLAAHTTPHAVATALRLGMIS